MMASLMTSLDIENETQKKHIQELEQFVNLLSSALTESGSEMVNPQNKPGEAALIKQFAHQFNLSMGSTQKQKQGK